MESAAVFAPTFIRGVFPQNRGSEHLRRASSSAIGLRARLEPGKAVPITVSWREHGGRAARVDYGGGRCRSRTAAHRAGRIATRSTRTTSTASSKLLDVEPKVPTPRRGRDPHQERQSAIDQLERTVAGPRKEANALDDDVAYSTLDARCKPDFARGFLLYQLYIRAAAFRPPTE